MCSGNCEWLAEGGLRSGQGQTMKDFVCQTWGQTLSQEPEEPSKGSRQREEQSGQSRVLEALEHPVDRGTMGPEPGRVVQLEKEKRTGDIGA